MVSELVAELRELLDDREQARSGTRRSAKRYGRSDDNKNYQILIYLLLCAI